MTRVPERLPIVALAFFLVAGCAASELPAVDPGLGAITLEAARPALLVPGSTLALLGSGFPDATRASARLHLEGRFAGESGSTELELTLPASAVEATRLDADPAPLFARLPEPRGRLTATLTALFDSPLDDAVYDSSTLEVTLEVTDRLTPQLQSVLGGALHVNDALLVDGDGFLLGGGEGDTHALVSGCFVPDGAPAGSACQERPEVDLIARPATPFDRTHLRVPVAPEVAGIGPGTFTGTLRLENRPAAGAPAASGSLPVSVTLRRPEIASVSPTTVSLGQIVRVAGGGFVGAAADEVTLLHLSGSYRPTGAASAAPVELRLVPRFVDGPRLEYVLDEEDALGQVLDLRRATGTFTGQVAPLVRKGAVELEGDPTPLQLTIAPVKQVVWVRFLPSYVDSLRQFGLGAVDAAVRARVLAVATRDYAGVNVEFRSEAPDDFQLYSQVDVAGPDPNDLGLFGYDNTPGKDVGNVRLFDKLGGVNATTQADGFPGFGGIFTEQFLGFSAHPGGRVAPLGLGTTAFDRLFDPLRPGTGRPAQLAELPGGPPALDSGSICPADPRDRQAVIACGVFVLGNLIGTTLTHEVGHSLGLADPTGELFHDPGDQPGRLMDAGDARPFEERAELGVDPARFCDEELDYLRSVLPGGAAAPELTRPDCR